MSENVGTAYAQIRLGLQQLSSDSQAAMRHARDIEGAYGQASRNITSLASSIERFTSNATAGLGALSAVGVGASQRVRNLDMRVKMLTGSEEAATRQMRDLRDMADRTGQPFLDMAESAASLLPALRGTNAELNTVVSIANRLKVVDPTARSIDMAISIREFISGEYMSLVRRFELSKGRLKQITEDAGGNVQEAMMGLSAYLDEMGITQDAMETLGESGADAFGIMRSEITETLGVAFMPFLTEAVLPSVQGISAMVRQVRELNPELLQTASIFAGMVGVPSMLGKVASTLNMPGIGRVAGVASAVGAGAAIGGITAGELSRRGAGPETVKDMSTMNRLKAALGVGATLLANATGKAAESLISLRFTFMAGGLKIKSSLNDMSGAIGRWIVGLASALSRLGIDTAGMAQSGLAMEAEAMQSNSNLRSEAYVMGLDYARNMENARAKTEEWTAAVAEWALTSEMTGEAVQQYYDLAEAVSDAGQAAEQTTTTMQDVDPVEFTGEQIEAWSKFQDDLSKIQDDARTNEEKAVDDYNERVASRTARYQLERTRYIEDSERKVAEHEATKLEIEKEGQKEIRKLRREQLWQEVQGRSKHAFNLLKAAAMLDADAIWQEQERYRQEKNEREHGNERAVEQQEEQITARLEREQAAIDKELDLRNVRLSRMQADLNTELQAYETQKNNRIAQIYTQMNAELQMRNQAFVSEFNALTQHEYMKLGIQNQGMAAIEANLMSWWQRMANEMGTMAARATRVSYSTAAAPTMSAGDLARTALDRYSSQLTPFALGGAIQHTGPILGHEGEFVLNRQATAALSRQMGGRIDQQSLINGGGRSIDVGGIYITQTDPSPQVIQDAVLDIMEELVS